MILENGFVKITGATDLEDSSMAAGLCAVFGHSTQSDLTIYINPVTNMYQRCDNTKYLFSRDQTIPLVAGLYSKNLAFLVSAERINGKDILSPSVRGHIRICQGLKPYWHQTLNFKLDLWFSATFKPRDELNQLFCMLLVHPDKSLIKWYCEMNPFWQLAIQDYLCGWREESELAELMIDNIKNRLKS